MPLTPEQRARIARENGAKSSGPVTPEGKERSSRNALKTGDHAAKLAIFAPTHPSILCNEDRQAFFRLVDKLISIYQPANLAAREIVHKMADAQWQVERLANCLAFHWKFAMIDAAASPITVVPEFAEAQVMHRASTALFSGHALADRLNRQIDRLELRIARLERRIKYVHTNHPHTESAPTGETPVENTELTPETPEIAAKNEPAVFVTENTPAVLEAYRSLYPGREIVILPPDNVAKGIDEPDDLPLVPRPAA